LDETVPYFIATVLRPSVPTLEIGSHGQDEVHPSVRKIHGGGGHAGHKSGVYKRLEGAYRSFTDIEPRDFEDDEMQVTFEQIRSRLTRIQHGRIDSIAATCRQMSDQEASEVADFIFSLFLRIAEKHHCSS
jgi:hypothetical protein